MIGDPAFSGTVQSAPVMAAIYMSGVTHADLVSSNFIIVVSNLNLCRSVMF
jgi:hypothetical protein